MTIPDARTKLLGVIGHPVAHSLSPAIFNAALRHDEVNADYHAFDVPPEKFAEAVRGLRAAEALGFNVTIPHKEAALALADDPSPEAERIGAANLLVFSPDAVRARNTDHAGITRALNEMDIDPAGKTVLVLGAGGAGKAAAWAVADAGGETVLLSNRTPKRAEDLCLALRRSGHRAHVVEWEARAEAAATSRLLINATSVGLDGPESPLGHEPLESARETGCMGLLDLVYGSEETKLARDARAAGLKAADGLDMLVYQAAESYGLLLGRPAPLEVMFEAAARAAGRPGPKRPSEGLPPLL
jgi:shikimate dehydrogenase